MADAAIDNHANDPSKLMHTKHRKVDVTVVQPDLHDYHPALGARPAGAAARNNSCEAGARGANAARDRQHRDHPRRPRTASTDDPGDERTEDLSLTDPYWWVVSRTTHRLFASLEPRLLDEAG